MSTAPCTIPRTVLAIHRPSPSNPRLTLCQEYAMRQGWPDGYDSLARVCVGPEVPLDCSPGTGHRRMPNRHIDTTFRAVAVWLGTEAAIRAVTFCAWQSRSDFMSAEPIPCTECEEIAHA